MTRVVVIGAGLAGLTLAQGLRKAGVDVRIYEKDAGMEARFQGYRIGLLDYGWSALRACLPEESYELAVATSGDLTGPGLLFDDQLRLLASGDEIGPPEDARVVDRHVFRHVLAGGLQDRIEYGKKLASFSETTAGVRAVFTDGTEVSGDVLVGADGGFSAVRRLLLPHVGFQTADLGGAMGRTQLTDQFRRLVHGRGTMVKGPGITLMLGRMEFRTPPGKLGLPPTDSYVRWVMLIPPDHPAGQPSDQPPPAIAVVRDLLRDWHPDIVDLIARADAHNSVIGFAQVLDQPVTGWDAERVTMLGDAAHLTLASGGNGANTALRDAETLCARLVGDGDLRAYQKEMLERGNAAVEFSKQNQKKFVPSSVSSSGSS
ncbi:FAD-dependent oxidoreductase [Fodinicola acaciae]|uniref:FAD-dependent oxidoreductase n=1 Tax=Fodinicola acaciae TaxID=2681555 RepID=UPI0013D7E1AC|nr:NAD(P)/FAD-dependent oxidoreductase [Fodinicola acaciae]